MGVSLSQKKEVCHVYCPFPSWGEVHLATLHLVTLGLTPPISLPDPELCQLGRPGWLALHSNGRDLYVQEGCSIKRTSRRLERWLRGYEHWLLFQRTQVQFPAPPKVAHNPLKSQWILSARDLRLLFDLHRLPYTQGLLYSHTYPREHTYTPKIK